MWSLMTHCISAFLRCVYNQLQKSVSLLLLDIRLLQTVALALVFHEQQD